MPPAAGVDRFPAAGGVLALRLAAMPGPRTKLSQELIENLCRALAAGTPIKYAAQLVNVHESRVHVWRRRGESYEAHLDNDGEVNTDEQVYLDLATQMREAQGRAVVGAVTRVREAMNGRGIRVVDGHEVAFSADPDWRAATWYLSHCHPAEFSPRIELTGADGGALTFQSALDTEIEGVLAQFPAAIEAAAVDAVSEEPTPTRGVAKVDLLG